MDSGYGVGATVELHGRRSGGAAQDQLVTRWRKAVICWIGTRASGMGSNG